MPEPSKDIIRITHDEATGSHVDDLIKRQMSLRGESGVTRDRGRVWYYQSWFLFLIVGGLAAFGAWSLLEPNFDDTYYFQGEIQKFDRGDSLLAAVFGDSKEARQASRDVGEGAGSITIKGQKIYLTKETRDLVDGRAKGRIQSDEINVGQTVGVYLEKSGMRRKEEVAIARFVDRSPPPQKPSEAAKELDQLERRSTLAGMLFFPMVAGLVGLAIGAVDG